MVLRAYKKMLITVIKWTLLIATIYIVFLSLTLDSGKEKSKVLAKQADKELQPSQDNLDIENSTENGDEVLKQTTKGTPTQTEQSTTEGSDIQTDEEGENEDIENLDSNVRQDTKHDDEDAVDNEVETKQQGKVSEDETADSKGSNEQPCSDLEFPLHFLSLKPWQAVDKTNSTYVYSAYFNRDNHNIHIIGVRKMENITLICQLWGGKIGAMRTLLGETKAKASLIDFQGFRYISTVFTCPSYTPETLSHVSLVTNHCEKANNILRVEVISKMTEFPRSLTVCISAPVVTANKPTDFVKWIEINRLLGVEKFIAYNFSSNSDMSRLLRLYGRKGIVETVQWHPPMLDSQLSTLSLIQEIQRYGQTAALNDCLYKCKKYSEFISNLGINEYMIPRGTGELNVIDSVRSLETKVPAYYLRKAFTEIDESKKQKTFALPPSEAAKTTLLIRTHGVSFTHPRIVPGVSSFVIPKQKVVLHLHTPFQSNQLLGTVIEDVLPQKVMQKAQTNIKAVLDEIGVFLEN